MQLSYSFAHVKTHTLIYIHDPLITTKTVSHISNAKCVSNLDSELFRGSKCLQVFFVSW